jgi:hypothetical protein
MHPQELLLGTAERAGAGGSPAPQTLTHAGRGNQLRQAVAQGSGIAGDRRGAGAKPKSGPFYCASAEGIPNSPEAISQSDSGVSPGAEYFSDMYRNRRYGARRTRPRGR